MRATFNNLVMILTVAGLTLSGSAALAKGKSNGSNGSSNNVSRNFSSKSFSTKSMPSLNLSSGNKFNQVQNFNSQGQSFKKIQSGNVLGKVQSSNLVNKAQLGTTLGSNGPKAKILQGNVLQGNNTIQKMPKILNQGLGNSKNGNKIVDPGFNKNKSGKQNFCKDFGKNKCHNNFCWPWWWSNCHTHCYDPCYDSCYNSYYYGCFTPYYGTTVVRVPVVIEKPVVVAQPLQAQPVQGLANAEQPNTQPVTAAADAPADEVATAEATADEASTAEARTAKLMQVPVGATITLRGEAFGQKAGRVAMQVGELLLGSKVTKWEDKAVTITLPQVGLATATNGKFLILKADGKLATEVPFKLVLPQAPAVTQQ